MLSSFFSRKDLTLPKQPENRPGDSCTNQLLSFTHKVFSAFDDSHVVSVVFLDTCKAFDTYCHKGKFYKLQQ